MDNKNENENSSFLATLEPFKFVYSILLVIFGIFFFIYIIKEWEKGAKDSPLRSIATQLAIATIFNNTIFSYYSIILKLDKEPGKLECKLYISLGMSLFFTIPSLLSSFLWTLEKILSRKKFLFAIPLCIILFFL
jgi:hypothetical protein